MQVYLKPDRRKKQLIPDGCFSYRNLPSFNLKQQEHISDYYAITDRHFKNPTKNPELKKKTKSKAKSKQKSRTKSQKCITIGSAVDHSQSLEKLQKYLNTLNKQKVDQIQQKQRIQNQVTLLTKQIMSPRNESESKYVQELQQKSKAVQELNYLHHDEDQNHKTEMAKLKKKLRELEKQKLRLEKQAQQEKMNKGPKKIKRYCNEPKNKSSNKIITNSKSKSKTRIKNAARSSTKV